MRHILQNLIRTALLLLATALSGQVLAGNGYYYGHSSGSSGSQGEDSSSCSTCDGKVTDLKLKYSGQQSGFIKVYQKDGRKVHYGSIQPGKEFSFDGSDRRGTLTSKIYLYINNQKVQEIHTSCSEEIGPGTTFGDFQVIESRSRNGGAICPVDDVPPPVSIGSCVGGTAEPAIFRVNVSAADNQISIEGSNLAQGDTAPIVVLAGEEQFICDTCYSDNDIVFNPPGEFPNGELTLLVYTDGNALQCGTEFDLSINSAGDGSQGPVGPQGPAGADGAQGPAGADGAQGPTGADGAQGPAGADGAQGPAGADGAQGRAGADGAQGPAGADGAQGPAGADGAQGLPGLDAASCDVAIPEIYEVVVQESPVRGLELFGAGFGAGGLVPQISFAGVPAVVCPTCFTESSIVLDLGSTLPASGEYSLVVSNNLLNPECGAEFSLSLGAVGATGPQGESGAIGPIGPQGPTGLRGLKGDDGEEGEIGRTGAVGPQGTQGIPGPIGLPGPVGPQGIQGPTGPEGEEGSRGSQGPQGIPGPQGPSGLPGGVFTITHHHYNIAGGKVVLGASCPAGSIRIGGGYNINEQDTLCSRGSYPSGSSDWLVNLYSCGTPVGTDNSGTACPDAVGTARVFALCMTTGAPGVDRSFDFVGADNGAGECGETGPPTF